MKRAALHLIVVGALVAPVIAGAQAQQPRAAAPAGPAGVTIRSGKVMVAGENPGIRLLDKEGGTILSQVSFWRVFWSPAGIGNICYVTVGDQKSNGLRIALTDNEKVFDFITNEMFGKVATQYKTWPFKVVKATITTTKWTGTERVENCRSAEYNVDLVWRDLDMSAVMNEGQLTDSTSPATPFHVSWVRIPAHAADIIINGKKQPGSVYPTGQGPVRATTASVIFGENWTQ